MNLLERYLQAIGQYLPSATRQDVLNELRVNLEAQIDDRAEELNRPLTDSELSQLLQAHGRPEVVAARYLPQRSLIGPTIFPSYLFTLRKAFPLVVLIYVIAQAISLFAEPQQGDLLRGIFRSIVQIVPTLLIFWASVTIVFAIIEFAHTRPGFDTRWMPSSSWDPTKLPTLHDTTNPKPKSFATRVADLGFHILWILYVLAIPAHPFLIIGPSDWYLRQLGNAAFAPAWATFYVLLLVLLGFQLITKILALNPVFDPQQPVLDLITKALGVASTAFLASMKTYFIATSPSVNQTALANVNHWMGVSFRILLVIVSIQLLIDAWKLLRPTIRAKSVLLF
jgi:hypothetical protein